MTAWPDRATLARYLREALARGDLATARNIEGALAMLDGLDGGGAEAGAPIATRPLTRRRLLTPCLLGSRHDKAALAAAS